MDLFILKRQDSIKNNEQCIWKGSTTPCKVLVAIPMNLTPKGLNVYGVIKPVMGCVT
jgi:hypothetical protein